MVQCFNSDGAKFQTTFVIVCFSFLTNYSLKRSLYVKLKDWMSNSVAPDETIHMSCLIWIYAVCKSLLLLPVAVNELKGINFFFFFFFFVSPEKCVWVVVKIDVWGISNEYTQQTISWQNEKTYWVQLLARAKRSCHIMTYNKLPRHVAQKLMLSIMGKNFSGWQFEVFFLIFHR